MRLHTGNKPVPYNTGKVKIGEFYVPPRRIPQMSADAYRLQSELMGWDTGERRLRRVGKIVLAVVAVLVLFLIKE